MPTTENLMHFSNVACLHKLNQFISNDTSSFQFVLTKGRVNNYNYELNESLKNNKSYWSKPHNYEKHKNINNLLYVIDNKSTDIWIFKDTNNIPRKHWEDKFNNGVIELFFIGKLYFDINTMTRIFGYNGFGKQGKFQIIKKEHDEIIKNILNYINILK